MRFNLKSCGYSQLALATFRRKNSLDLVQLRFHVILGDAVTE